MAARSGAGCLVASAVWLVILAILAVAARYFLLPAFQSELVGETGTESVYRETVAIAVDSFSGYAALRSDTMAAHLRAQGVRLVVKDDGADYDARLKALRSGEIQMAVFTLDSLLSCGVRLGSHPASIVAILDETTGADALVAYRTGVAGISDLNAPDARIVLTPRSPAEFLARTVVAHFDLPNLPKQWMEPADGAEAVYRKFRAADRSARRAYALWEPYVSKALAEPDAHVLLDSSRLRGYIVDVLVAERRFLRDRPDTVRAVLEAYFRAAHAHLAKPEARGAFLAADAAQAGGEALTSEQARRLADGIAWKNTLDNYAAFGIERAPGTLLLEDMLGNVAEVLVKTGALVDNPVTGTAGTFYHAAILARMREDGFHPARMIPGLGDAGDGPEALVVAQALPDLTETEWAALVAVGSMRAAPIAFARGTARLNVQSGRDLEALAKTLAAWPRYYLVVRGHTRAEGDPDANLALARARAEAALEELVRSGVSRARLRADARIGEGEDPSGQRVSFELLQKPY